MFTCLENRLKNHKDAFLILSFHILFYLKVFNEAFQGLLVHVMQYIHVVIYFIKICLSRGQILCGMLQFKNNNLLQAHW